MHRPSLPITLFLLGGVSVALGACDNTPAKPRSEMTGREHFIANCARCHGHAGEGSFAAPKLVRLTQHWDRERMVSYMREPEMVIAADPRLKEQGLRYSTRMPAFPQLAPSERQKIADWLLAEHP